jgi:hypothetical protein
VKRKKKLFPQKLHNHYSTANECIAIFTQFEHRQPTFLHISCKTDVRFLLLLLGIISNDHIEGISNISYFVYHQFK